MVGLFSLISGVADAVNIPVVATGGIADGRGIAAALLLGASAVQIGTAFLRCPEAKIPNAWADAIGKAAPEDTIITRTLTGRPARSIATEFVRAAMAPTAPPPAPYSGATRAHSAHARRGHQSERCRPDAGLGWSVGPVGASRIRRRSRSTLVARNPSFIGLAVISWTLAGNHACGEGPKRRS